MKKPSGLLLAQIITFIHFSGSAVLEVGEGKEWRNDVSYAVCSEGDKARKRPENAFNSTEFENVVKCLLMNKNSGERGIFLTKNCQRPMYFQDFKMESPQIFFINQVVFVDPSDLAKGLNLTGSTSPHFTTTTKFTPLVKQSSSTCSPYLRTRYPSPLSFISPSPIAHSSFSYGFTPVSAYPYPPSFTTAFTVHSNSSFYNQELNKTNKWRQSPIQNPDEAEPITNSKVRLQLGTCKNVSSNFIRKMVENNNFNGSRTVNNKNSSETEMGQLSSKICSHPSSNIQVPSSGNLTKEGEKSGDWKDNAPSARESAKESSGLSGREGEKAEEKTESDVRSAIAPSDSETPAPLLSSTANIQEEKENKEANEKMFSPYKRQWQSIWGKDEMLKRKILENKANSLNEPQSLKKNFRFNNQYV